jgi:chitodextrinase
VDDGSRGDTTADDGLYTADYVIPPGVEASGAILTGRFQDAAGNVTTRQATDPVTIDVPPPAVTLSEAFNVQETSVELSWTRSSVADFDAYRIQRAESAVVLSDPARVLVRTITGRATTTTTDTDLAEGTTYYYLVEVVDDFGSATASNVISVTTGDEPPTQVSLAPPASVADTAIILSWGESPDDDFAGYRIYRAQSASVSDASTLVATITTRSVTQVEDTGLVENTRYWYRLYVDDLGGAATSSPPREITTSNRAPEPVTLSSVVADGATAMNLTWTASDAHDFAAYRIFRAETDLVDDSDPLIRSVTTSSITTFRDTGLQDNTTYHYRIYVADTADSTAASGVLSGTTDNAPPPSVTLTEVSHTVVSVSLGWTEAAVEDFDRYEIHRADETAPGSFAQVATVTRRDQLAHTDFFPEVTSDFIYFYRLTVYDTGGSATDSNVIAVPITP